MFRSLLSRASVVAPACVSDGAAGAAGEELVLTFEGWARSTLGDPALLPVSAGARRAAAEDGPAACAAALGPDAAGGRAPVCSNADDCGAASCAIAGEHQTASQINNSPVT